MKKNINHPPLYVCIELDESPTRNDVHYAFMDLDAYLEDHNECMETTYSTIEEFNQGEEFRTIYVTEMPAP